VDRSPPSDVASLDLLCATVVSISNKPQLTSMCATVDRVWPCCVVGLRCCCLLVGCVFLVVVPSHDRLRPMRGQARRGPHSTTPVVSWGWSVFNQLGLTIRRDWRSSSWRRCPLWWWTCAGTHERLPISHTARRRMDIARLLTPPFLRRPRC
jgi:hypothetical protein